MKIRSFKPRVTVYHSYCICFNIRDLIISLYQYKHNTLSYNIINMSAALNEYEFRQHLYKLQTIKELFSHAFEVEY